MKMNEKSLEWLEKEGNQLLEERISDEKSGPEKPNILIIDDEEIIGNMFKSLLSSKYKVDIALSGREAVKKIRKKKYHVVTIDLKMDDMNGVQTYQALYSLDPRFQGIFVTGFPNEITNVKEVVRLYGAAGFFEKTGFNLIGNAKQFDKLLNTIDMCVKTSDHVFWERDYIRKIQDGLKPQPTWLYNIIGGKLKERPFQGDPERIRLVTAANDSRKPVAAYRDVSENEVRKAIERCQVAASYFKSLTKDTMDELNRIWAGFILNSKYDYHNAAVLNGPWDVINRDKHMIAQNILLGDRYLDFLNQHPEEVNAIPRDAGTAFLVVNASMRVTPAYPSIGTKRRRISSITRPESARPIPGYESELAFIRAWVKMQKKGRINPQQPPPSQILFWDNRVHRDFGKLIGEAVDFISYMGHPLTAWYMLNSQDLRLIVNTEHARISLKEARQNTPLDPKVGYYVANKTACFLGGEGLDRRTIDSMISELAFSCRSHDLSCKRAILNTVDEMYFDYVKQCLISVFESYRIGEVGDRNCHIVRKSDEQWEEVKNYLASAEDLGLGVEKCGDHTQAPRMIIIDDPKKHMNKNNGRYNEFRNFLSKECKHPVMILSKGSKEISHELAKLMAYRNHEGKNLQRYIYSEDDDVIEYFHSFESAARESPGNIMRSIDAYDLYIWGDGPATDGLGNLVDMENKKNRKPRIRAHEHKIL